MSIVWNEKYSVGIEAIDEQHKKFIAILNQLSDAFLAGGKEACGSIIKELESYAEEHFAFEERSFKEFGFDGTVEHVACHDTYREKVRVFEEKLATNDPGLEYELFEFIESWLTDHIQKEDKKYAELFIAKGMK